MAIRRLHSAISGSLFDLVVVVEVVVVEVVVVVVAAVVVAAVVVT